VAGFLMTMNLASPGILSSLWPIAATASMTPLTVGLGQSAGPTQPASTGSKGDLRRSAPQQERQ
jgi:hypothetical protein